MPEWTGTFFTWLLGGASAGGGFAAIRWFLEYMAGRYDKREALIEVGTEKLIRHLEEQVARLLLRLTAVEDDHENCLKRHAELQEEVSRLRGLFQGQGDARQLAAMIVASEKGNGK